MHIEFKPWEILDRNLFLSARPWFEVWRERVRLPDGRVIPDYYQLVVPDASVVVAITPEQELLTLRQYKHGAGATIWGLPAGFCKNNEHPMDCAQRELLEETGYQAQRWVALGTYVRDANRGGGAVHAFLALNARKVAEPNSDDLEEYRMQCLTMVELLGLIRRRQIKPLGVIAAVLLAHLYLEDQNGAIPGMEGLA